MAGKKHKILVSITALFAALIMAASQNTFAFDADETSNQISEIEQQNSEYKQQLEETKATLKEKQEYSKKLQKQILDLSKKIQNSNKKISKLNATIKAKQAKIDKKLDAIQDRLNLLRNRLRTIQKTSDVSSLEIILGAKNFSDLIDKAELVKSLSSYDEKLIKKLQTEMDTISKEQKQLKSDKASVEKEKRSLEKNKEKINTLSQENTKIIEQLTETAENTEDTIKKNQEQQKELIAALEKYNEEMAEKARLAAQRAKELAEQKAAQQAAQNKNDNNNDSNNDDDTIVIKSDGSFVWPCPGHTYLTSTFEEWRGSSNHGALDIADGSVYGAKVVACYDGTVFSANSGCPHDYGKNSSCGCGGGYGNYVMIDHGNGKISIYGHLSGVTVSIGDRVVAGQLIGYVGSTGYSTGPHLHFEMQQDGIKYNPMIEFNS
ncbi:MAG: peptidoglycan DD-metalloendopeptidase family protein [Clostridia bacterium]|nr:peptidoglycan DD-metalloendopeptidase family protein [Clostridia bacterium]